MRFRCEVKTTISEHDPLLLLTFRAGHHAGLWQSRSRVGEAPSSTRRSYRRARDDPRPLATSRRYQPSMRVRPSAVKDRRAFFRHNDHVTLFSVWAPYGLSSLTSSLRLASNSPATGKPPQKYLHSSRKAYVLDIHLREARRENVYGCSEGETEAWALAQEVDP